MVQQEAEAERRLDELQTRLGLAFKRRELLREAMTHTSWINERGAQGRDNERLEYLGDAVLELVAGEYLFSRFPNYDEGQLTQMRSSLVSTVALAKIGEQLYLGETLRLGRGAAKSGARRLTSLHANAFEALIGAIFLDQGYRRAGKVFLIRIGDLSAWTDPNFKGRLQALAQERFGAPPQYKTGPSTVDPRSRQYISQVSVEGRGQLGEGRGGTKQAAEQGAARAAIDLLVAPVSKKRRRRKSGSPLEQAQAALALAPAAEGTARAETAPSTGEPAAPRRRRRRATASATSEAPPPSVSAAALELQPVVAEAPVAPTETAPKRRRRRSAKSQPTVPSSAADPAIVGEQPTAPQPVTASADSAAPKRRRRRSSRSQSGAGAAVAAPVAVSAEPMVAEQSAAQPSAGQVAPRRRRRRGTKAVTGEPAAPVAAAATAVPSGADEETPSGSTDGSPRKRSHRGRRGGRKRSGRAATPIP
jgi:ribonuclease-3